MERPFPGKPRRFLTLDLPLAGLAVLWLVLLGTASIPGNIAVPVTLGLLAISVTVGMTVLIRDKRVALLLGLVQVVLFGTLHAQIYTHWGQDHYRCAHTPELFDWIGFTSAHVLRAADVLDVIRDFGIPIQAIEHASMLSGTLLVVMHVTVDIFLLALAIRWGTALWQRLTKRQGLNSVSRRGRASNLEPSRQGTSWTEAFKLSLFVWLVFFLITALIQGWRWLDWLLWPLDSAARVVDIGDAMQVYNWKLHAVEPGFIVAALAISLRLLVGISITRWLRQIHLRMLGRWAIRTLDDLTHDLSDHNPEIRRAAAAAIGKVGTATEDSIRGLLRTISDPTPEVRQAAVSALRSVDRTWTTGPLAQEAAPFLVPLLTDTREEVRQATRNLLAELGPEAVPSLIAALPTSETSLRLAVLSALEQIGPRAQGAVAGLLPLLADAEAGLREGALRTLEQVDPHWADSPQVEAAMPDLSRALTAPDWVVRVAAVEAIGKIGHQVAGAISVLIQALRDQEPEVGRVATTALIHLGKAAVPALSRVLVSDNSLIRRNGLLALGRIGPPAVAALPAILRTLRDPQPGIREASAESLGRIGSTTHAAVPALIDALGDVVWSVRRSAAEALGRIGPGAREAVPALQRAQADADEHVQEAATLALEAIAFQESGGPSTAGSEAVP